jgi:nitroimidazol reductase NimA-like FMN-containing flavoprotein (pyridoxamine 5'-phosphate oxidase superfamily)
MKSYKVVSLPFIFMLLIALTALISFSQEESKPVPSLTPAGPIPPDAVMSPKHPAFSPKITCAECHETKFDAVSTATKQCMKNYKLLDKETVWKYILELLPGRERFVMATIYEKRTGFFKREIIPTTTTIDFVLNPDEKALYAVCEKGTEKLEQIKLNPVVCASHYEGWTVAQRGKQVWKSAQVKGKAEIIEAQDPRFNEALQKYQLVRTKPEQAQKRFHILKVAIDQIIYFNTDFLKEGISIYQVWEK